MNDNKKKILQRRGALLLATILCISVMAGCGTAKQQKTTEKTPTQQSQQAAPKADSSKKDANKKKSSGKTTGSQSNNKPAGSQTSANKPADSQTGTNKPAGSQTSTNKPAGSQSGTSKPADKKEAPSIRTQPQSVTVAAGSSFKFTVSAIGANLKYIWQVDKNDGKGWTDIPDANEPSYTVKNAGAEQNGWKFRCIVSNDAGKAESAVATLSVDSSVKSKQG